LRELAAAPQSELAVVARRYDADRGSLTRAYPVAGSPTRLARLKKFHTEWISALEKLDADKLSKEGQADLTRLKDAARRALRELEAQAKADAEVAPLVPFAPAIIGLEEARRRMERIDSMKAAGRLTELRKQIAESRKALEAALKGEGTVAVN